MGMFKQLCVGTGAVIAAVALAGAAQADTFTVSYEAPGVQSTTASFDVSGVETFESFSTGAGQTLNSGFGGNGVITGTYNNVQLNGADQYGSAGGAGNYAVTFGTAGYELALSSTDPKGINYFGYWLSALDGGNQVTFFKGATQVFSFNPTDVLALVGSNSDYFGNPNAPFLGNNKGEPYVFLNFFDDTGTFDRIVFAENPAGGGYESDNHTVGFFKDKGTGTEIPGVPEPASWAMMISGFGMVGAAMRRRAKVAQVAIA